MSRAYELDDPRPIAASAPYTFFLPSNARLAAVRPGDAVQLLFRSLAPSPEYEVERMWVLVQLIEGEHFAGVLESKPFDMPGVSKGERIRFERFNIISVDFEDRARAPDEQPVRDYWERCLVDRCVLDDDVAIEFLYREAPEPMRENDKYPDSGWRIRGDSRGWTQSEMDERDVSYVALGAVLNRDDTWLSLVDEPVGSAFTRDFVTNTYVRDKAND